MHRRCRFEGTLLPHFLVPVILVAGLTKIAGAVPDGQTQVNTTLEDFFLPGTQPDPTGAILTPFFSGFDCQLCHGDFDQAEPPLPPEAEPFRNWTGSMMGQATKDPVFWACLTVANQDVAFGGDMCLRCHTPAGWLQGRSVPTDGSALVPFTADFEGVSCHFCHRMVDPFYEKGINPVEDVLILEDLEMAGLLPTQLGAGMYIADPEDVRRGPFDPDTLPFNPHGPFTPIIESDFHTESDFCATCHDVSNPLYELQEDGSYLMTDQDESHPSLDKFQMFPIERTYSEWAFSQFADGGVQMNGRFGGAHATGIMETCQDCHMPDQVSPGCRVPGFEDHLDMPAHFFNGGNTWVLNAVYTLYTDGDEGLNDPIFFDQSTGLTPEIISDSITRAEGMLRDASDMELTVEDDKLNVRIINFSGHKLPTGYNEGRRMWINVKFLDDEDELILEHGFYDFATAELTDNDTKVYKAVFGIDAAVAALTGLPEGESNHFVLNNVVLFDNRIPPFGFTNAAYEAVQAEPEGYVYADGQNWDDTLYQIPKGAAKATVTLYFQLTSKDYIEFLRDQNVTDNRGQIAYDQWVLHGMSAPVDMDMGEIEFGASIPGDLNDDGMVNAIDLAILLGNWGPCPGCPADIDGDGTVGPPDLAILLGNWG